METDIRKGKGEMKKMIIMMNNYIFNFRRWRRSGREYWPMIVMAEACKLIFSAVGLVPRRPCPYVSYFEQDARITILVHNREVLFSNSGTRRDGADHKLWGSAHNSHSVTH